MTTKASTSSLVQEQYALPQDMPICEAVYSLFSHYASPWKSSYSDQITESTIDGVSFVRMCQEAPGLASKKLTRHEFDLVFTKAKAVGERRLKFDEFLNALLDLATRKFPRTDPATAFSKLCTSHLFGLFDLQPTFDSLAFQKVRYDIMGGAQEAI